jgi:hypothetical protein
VHVAPGSAPVKEVLMRKGFWLGSGMVLWLALTASSSGHAAQLAALDDQDLKQVHGTGLDADLLKQLQQLEREGRRRQLGNGPDAQDHTAMSAQHGAALMAALELQINGGIKAATLAVNAVNAGTQLGGTLIALTPSPMLAPIGMPLFGLPSLPSHHSGGNSR